jgi:predicted transport protein
MAEGYIYILLNRAFQNDHYKIGMTAKKSRKKRARELSSGTGVPRAFEVLYEQRVSDCERAERVLHQRLDRYRPVSNREFFEMPLKVAIKALERVADEIGRADVLMEPDAAISPAVASPTGEISVGSPRRPRATAVPAKTSFVFEDHLSYTSSLLQQVLRDLRERLFGLDQQLRDEERRTSGQRIAYNRLGSKIFLEIKVQRAAIVLHVADGGLSDPEGITEDIPESHGWRQLKKRIVVMGMDNLNSAMPFVEAAYQTIL